MLPLYRQHCTARDNIFHAQHSYASDHDEVDVAREQPEEPTTGEAPFVPVTEQLGTTTFFPTNPNQHEAVQAQHDYASAKMHSSIEEVPNRNFYHDTVRNIPGDDDGVGPDAEKWRAAMATKVATLKRCGTWNREAAPLCRIDVSNAFLYEIGDAIIYVEQPHAFEEDSDAICLLHESLYGIKQAPRLWQQYLHTVLIELRFQQLPYDQGMYRLKSREKFILLVTYVDDLRHRRQCRDP
ncbi:unnamed protein product [Closterium sp. NIES-53]